MGQRLSKKGGANNVVVILSALLAATIAIFITYVWQQKRAKDFASGALASPTPEVILAPDSAPAVALPEAADEELIKQAMAAKHSRAVEETIINISKKDDSHAWGSVKFAGELAGGWFLAAKNSGVWIIVDDGNGTISCELIAPYDFPSEMVPECVDMDGNLIAR